MLNTFRVHIQDNLLREIKDLSKEKQILLNKVIFKLSRNLFLLAIVRGLFKPAFLISAMALTVALASADILSERMISSSFLIHPFAVFSFIGSIWAIYRTSSGVVIKASPYTEDVSPLKRPDGSLFFAIYFKNSFNGDSYLKEVWTGERFFWEKLRAEKDAES